MCRSRTIDDQTRYACADVLAGEMVLSQAARDAIDREPDGGETLISAISALEIAEFVKEGRLGLSMDALS